MVNIRYKTCNCQTLLRAETNSLVYDSSKCINCGLCSIVCPHAVFGTGEKVALFLNPEACMECGACQLNCPTNAIQVNSGVGCAAAMINAILSGKDEPSCGGGDDSACCCG